MSTSIRLAKASPSRIRCRKSLRDRLGPLARKSTLRAFDLKICTRRPSERVIFFALSPSAIVASNPMMRLHRPISIARSDRASHASRANFLNTPVACCIGEYLRRRLRRDCLLSKDESRPVSLFAKSRSHLGTCRSIWRARTSFHGSCWEVLGMEKG